MAEPAREAIARWPVECARPSDAEAIAALGANAFARGWSEASIAAELTRPDAEVWAVRAGGGISGFLLARRALDQLEVLLVAVRAAERRRGVGAALVAGALDAARLSGLRVVHLEVRASNAAAIRLYRRHGFREVGRRTRYYEGREDAVLMSLALREDPGR